MVWSWSSDSVRKNWIGFIYKVTRLIYGAWGTILPPPKKRSGFLVLVWQYCGKKVRPVYLQTKFEILSLQLYVLWVVKRSYCCINSWYKSNLFWPSLNNALCFQRWSTSILKHFSTKFPTDFIALSTLSTCCWSTQLNRPCTMFPYFRWCPTRVLNSMGRVNLLNRLKDHLQCLADGHGSLFPEFQEHWFLVEIAKLLDFLQN